ncbi:MAG: hypothetical protein CM15mV60_180 [uncultured marine virus]|nr:MAG: hypothetical protein CM15mV60_180 [uncultured marine virus]
MNYKKYYRTELLIGLVVRTEFLKIKTKVLLKLFSRFRPTAEAEEGAIKYFKE